MKHPNITKMTAKQHRFEGFAIRLSRNNYRFRCYVSASAKSSKFAGMNKPKLTYRRALALEEAKNKLASLIEVLNKPTSWRSGKLTKKSLSHIQSMGFASEAPVFVEA